MGGGYNSKQVRCMKLVEEGQECSCKLSHCHCEEENSSYYETATSPRMDQTTRDTSTVV